MVLVRSDLRIVYSTMILKEDERSGSDKFGKLLASGVQKTHAFLSPCSAVPKTVEIFVLCTYQNSTKYEVQTPYLHSKMQDWAACLYNHRQPSGRDGLPHRLKVRSHCAHVAHKRHAVEG